MSNILFKIHLYKLYYRVLKFKKFKRIFFCRRQKNLNKNTELIYHRLLAFSAENGLRLCFGLYMSALNINTFYNLRQQRTNFMLRVHYKNEIYKQYSNEESRSFIWITTYAYNMYYMHKFKLKFG